MAPAFNTIEVILTTADGMHPATSSKMEVQGLERAKQYWFRVRAVRVGQTGP